MSDSKEILDALLPVATTLEELGVRYQVCGSLASSALGVLRATADADLVADLAAGHVPFIAARLKAAYYLNEQAMAQAVRDRASFNLVHLASMLKVDVFVLKGRPYDRQALLRAVLIPLDVDVPDARPYPVSSAEDVVIAKLEWFRKGGETSERQWEDILGVLRVQAKSLDRVYLEHWTHALRLDDLLARAFRESDLGGS